jgi:hypothetical protein
MTDDRGNCRPPGPAAGGAGGGVETGCGLDGGAAVSRAVVAAMGRGGATAVASLSSKRRSNPRSNPANFDFTMFDMANYAIPVFYKINKTPQCSRNLATNSRN